MPLQVRSDAMLTVLLLDRPERAHAYDRELLGKLDAAIADVNSPVVVVGSTGSGAFCGGADLNEMRQAHPTDALDLYSQAVFQRLATAPFVSVAAVQGAAVAGGCELALACDLRIAGPAARFSLPETSLGLIPSAGGCTRLPRIIGLPRAREVILAGRVVDAETALAWGLVNRLSSNLQEDAVTWAREIAERDPLAQRLAKSVLAGELEGSLKRERLAEALLYARKLG